MSDKIAKVAWCGWEADDANGYATISRRFRTGFNNIPGIQFVNNYEYAWDALVAVATPIGWVIGSKPTPRPDLVFHTMYEAEPLPPGWVTNLNCAGLVWTPSKYCADLFRSEGVTTDIVTIGYGIDHNMYTYHNRHGRRGPMRFLIWGDTMTSRKNILATAKAFVRAGLPNDAELEIKLHSFAGASDNTMFVDSLGKPLANVSLHQGIWSREKLIRWLHDGDCLIYLSGGEGFGQMPLEAMATGLPVICTYNTGMTEFLSPDVAMLVPTAGRAPFINARLGFGYDATICKPDYDAAVDWIKWVYNHREAAYDIGDAAQEMSLGWQWSDVCNRAASVILDRYGH